MGSDPLSPQESEGPCSGAHEVMSASRGCEQLSPWKGCPHKQEPLGSPGSQPGCSCLSLLDSESWSLALIVAGGYV